MTDEPTTPEAADEAPATAATSTPEVNDVLVEEVSIDGMCGVY